ncbi:MAG: Transcription antitermination protein NusB [Chlamydiia bacterium]|nr:Transcription antitermination protein NusB [Chlamydiia bacterium]MCH9618101.1 Transcription antitermination protein NusB [Chlamydiia bacterium]MCH9623981.1 Transcription antitermination protein NusB [Chlamydiia bacterium]
MDMSPRKSREIYVQMLYLLEDNDDISLDSLVSLMSVFRVSKKNMLEFFEKAKEIFNARGDFDSYLGNISEEYSLDRIAKVDLAILRVVLYELELEKIPVEVGVAEALRIANKFSSFGAGKYLHAMIDSVYKEMKHDNKMAAH